MPSSSLVHQLFLPVPQFPFQTTEDSYVLINTNSFIYTQSSTRPQTTDYIAMLTPTLSVHRV